MKKKELRRLYKKKREALSSSEIDNLSKGIANIFFENAFLKNIGYLHSFVPIENKAEVNTWLIIDKLKLTDTNVVISKSNFDTGSLKHYLFSSSTELITNEYGIEEPSGGMEVDESILDVVIVPLLAFDEKGQRVGYGKGFYDRFLNSCRSDVKKVGVSFFEPCELIEDTNNTDIPLDICITPSKIYEF